jgi:hypothetical protein
MDSLQFSYSLKKRTACWRVIGASMNPVCGKIHRLSSILLPKIGVLQRQAYGFRNFANYRLRVRAMCS